MNWKVIVIMACAGFIVKVIRQLVKRAKSPERGYGESMMDAAEAVFDARVREAKEREVAHA